MYDDVRKVSFFMAAFILIIFALLPLFSMIENGFDSTDYYYEQYN